MNTRAKIGLYVSMGRYHSSTIIFDAIVSHCPGMLLTDQVKRVT